MRIGIDISPLTPARTGVGNYCYYLLRHLIRVGADCEFAGFSSGRAPIKLGDLDRVLIHRHIPVPTRLLYAAWSALGAPKVDAVLGGVDVYHATNYFLPPTKSAARVVSFHDLAFLVTPELSSPKIQRLFAKGVRRFAKEADAVLTCSASTKADIVRMLEIAPERVTVTPYAAGDHFAPMDPAEAQAYIAEHYGVPQPFLLFVGTLEPRKNIPTLLRAFAAIAHQVPHTLVLLGAAGWHAQPIFDTIEELDLSQRVVHLGFVRSAHDLCVFYCAADVFVFPTLYEGFGLPILEAMKCGCPVVTSNNSSIPEVAGDAALCHDACDVEAIAGAIRNLIEDARLRESMVAKGFQQANRFSWEACARTTLDVYRRVAKGR